jgi:TPR repeat protein
MAKLSDLILLRNDPAVAEEFLEAAKRGDVDAQYGMGLIYAEGRGVPQDEARAYFWLTLAMEQGDHDAESLRRVVAENMAPEQFTQADMLLKDFALMSTADRASWNKQRSSSDLH